MGGATASAGREANGRVRASPPGMTHVYSWFVKTAISVPDPLFARVDRHAKRLGLSRSAFFATAAERLADELDEDDLTDEIDRALATAGEEDSAFVRRAAVHLLGSEPGAAAGAAPEP